MLHNVAYAFDAHMSAATCLNMCKAHILVVEHIKSLSAIGAMYLLSSFDGIQQQNHSAQA